MKVTARGLEFDVHTGGPSDGHPVLLLHGFPQHGGMWDRVVPALHAAGLRTFAPDQRGYSPHARPSDVDGYAMDDCVVDAVALMDALGLARAHVVGHDWGSVVGWHLAGRHAERVDTFTAVSVPHPAAVELARRGDGGDQRQRSQYMKLFAIKDKAEELLLEDDARRLRRLFDPLAPDRAELRPAVVGAGGVDGCTALVPRATAVRPRSGAGAGDVRLGQRGQGDRPRGRDRGGRLCPAWVQVCRVERGESLGARRGSTGVGQRDSEPHRVTGPENRLPHSDMMRGVTEFERAVDMPRTRTSLAADLRSLGVRPGSILLVHSSMKSLGWVVRRYGRRRPGVA